MGNPNGDANSSTTPNQSGIQDDQNFEIDINQIYSDWIQRIDAIRSNTNINSNPKVLDNLGKTVNITGISKLLKMENKPQESRCHAFFRMIGLPVVGSGKGSAFYNPGFDIVQCLNKKIEVTTKVAIAKDPILKFNALSEARETFSQDNLQIFSNPTNITAGVLALSSGGTQKLRSFVAPLEKSAEPFDMEVKNQSYDVNLDSLVGKNKNISLTKYQDQDGDSPAENHPEFVTQILSKRTHIIKPFIVDARIDLTVSPQSKLMAVPFVSDVSQTKVSATENVQRPIIEKIIRERLSTDDPTSTVGTSVESVLKYVQSVPAIKDSGLVTLVTTKDVYKQSDRSRFIDSVNTIRTMIKKLVDSQKLIRAAQGYYYWVPVPDPFGPENGCTVPGVFLPTVIDQQLVTPLDKEIITSFAQAKTSSLNSQAQAAVQLDFPVPTISFGSDTASGLGDNNAQNLETLSQTRKRVLTKASEALRTVEIIMGEFSGLGLCDIIAIISALNIMKIDKLVGLLDDGSFERLKTSLKLTPQRDGDINSCLTELTEKVKDYYNLMDKIYADEKNRGGLP